MSRWFRMYADVLDDPKVQRLPAELFKIWVNLLCLASRNEGVIPCAEDVAFALRITPAKASEVISQFIERGLMDQMNDELKPHNWDKRQYKSDKDETAAKRQANKRERDKMRDVTRDTSVMSPPPETDTETDTETDKKDISCQGAKAPQQPAPTSQIFFNGINDAEIPRRTLVALADDFSLAEDWGQYAEKLGWVNGSIAAEAVKWHAYWTVGKGAGKRRAVKGWRQSWNNWLENAERFSK